MQQNYEILKNSLTLGSGTYKLYFHLVQKTYQAISPEAWLQFSQTRLHFIRNHKLNPIKQSKLKEFLDLEVWDL